MATTALVPFKELDAEQIALVKRTVAVGATDDELALFFFDCQRRGVHPLDKLIHFTKRKGKYTPITSIDFFRTRAHDTGKCAGITDAQFSGEVKSAGFAATVTVRRVVEGIVAEFTATARWAEYKPDENAFMWLKMPHTMLGKCAEALALRKAFPHELAGLYTGDEMAQAGAVVSSQPTDAVNVETGEIVEVEAKTKPDPIVAPKTVVTPERADQSYTGVVTVLGTRKKGAVTIYEFDIDGQIMSTVDETLAATVTTFATHRAMVTYSVTAKGGLMLKAITAAEMAAEEIAF
jgi:phage recombination protein Bet